VFPEVTQKGANGRVETRPDELILNRCRVVGVKKTGVGQLLQTGKDESAAQKQSKGQECELGEI
jgi:hypothetical protein